MTPNELQERRKQVIKTMRWIVTGEIDEATITREGAEALLAMLEEPVVEVVSSEPELPEYKLSDDVLEHVEANDYTLKPQFTSVWIGVDSIAVYIRRMNGGLLVEVHPNNDEAAGRPYANAYVEFEPEEGAE